MIRYVILCQCPGCTAPATMRAMWRTPQMPATAFYYSCTAHQWTESTPIGQPWTPPTT